jgi:hypothetical protein
MIEVSGIAKTPIERFKSGFINLALPFFGFSEPIRAPVKKVSQRFCLTCIFVQYNDREFTLWTGLDVKGPLTLQQLLDWLKVSACYYYLDPYKRKLISRKITVSMCQCYHAAFHCYIHSSCQQIGVTLVCSFRMCLSQWVMH